MARAIAGEGGLIPQAPQRRGKYDAWLDGRIWEVNPPRDSRWREPQRLLRALRQRARRRGLSVGWQPLEDGSISVQALRRRAN